jgi:hypothetical protein
MGLCVTLIFDLNAPNPPTRVGRRCVRNGVRSCPSDLFFCSLGRRARAALSDSALRCRRSGSVNDGARSASGNSGTTAVDELAVADPSARLSNCLNLLKYRSDANSVIWRGSMMFCAWPLCHPVTERKWFEGSLSIAGPRGTTRSTERLSVRRQW